MADVLEGAAEAVLGDGSIGRPKATAIGGRGVVHYLVHEELPQLLLHVRLGGLLGESGGRGSHAG